MMVEIEYRKSCVLDSAAEIAERHLLPQRSLPSDFDPIGDHHQEAFLRAVEIQEGMQVCALTDVTASLKSVNVNLCNLSLTSLNEKAI